MLPGLKRLVLVVVALGAVCCALPGCSATSNHGTTSVVPLGSGADASGRLGCTPVQLSTFGKLADGSSIRGEGSGVFVHPRVIATAGHVVPDVATYVTCFVAGERMGEVARIVRVERGERNGFWDGDWALIVLAKPFRSLPVQVAETLLPWEEPAMMEAAGLTIAGYPFASESDYQVREPVMVSTIATPPPFGLPESHDVIYASRMTDLRDLAGASGGPVVQRRNGVPTLVGLYSGTAEKRFLGLEFSSAAVCQRIPELAIRTLVSELGDESVDVEPGTAADAQGVP